MNKQRKVLITITYNEMGIIIDTKAEKVEWPEKRTEERTETHGVCLDAISRQAAIDAVQNRPMMLSKEKVLLINDLEKLPPAQPESDSGRWENLQPVFTEIAEEYKKACEISYINKPLAYALHEVWKKHDRRDTNRNE